MEHLTRQPIDTVIWGDSCKAIPVSRDADKWFSEVLETSCRLVYMPDEVIRPVKEKYRVHREIVSFADGVPYLIVGQASLDHLNQKLLSPITMDHFRTNFVFSGGNPHVEDTWSTVQVGTEGFFNTGVNWARCPVITVNIPEAKFQKEPLRTLASYRKEGNHVYFGKSLLLNGKSGGVVKVGDIVTAK